MLRGWRWSVVLAAAAALAAVPTLVAALPASGGGPSAAQLLARIKASAAVGYSGYAESSGGLALPVTSDFSSLTDLLGDTSQLRVWWRSGQDWRVDLLSATGESDMQQDGPTTWTWDYEANVATVTEQSPSQQVRLPVAADLLPPSLGRRLLSGATPAQVRRLPSVRVAGRDAAGVRLRPGEPGSTIDHVDVWADPRTGLPLRVEVAGAGLTVMSTQFLDLDTRAPSAATTGFTPPPGARVRGVDQPDLAAEVEHLEAGAPPARLAGFARSDVVAPIGAIGVYGQGVTEFAAAPLPYWDADELRAQLAGRQGSSDNASEQWVTVGPLSLVLTQDVGERAWLLTGTVTLGTLRTAADELLRGAGGS